jgi:hypothetical protein
VETLCQTADAKGMTISFRNPLTFYMNTHLHTQRIYELLQKDFIPRVSARGPVDFILVITPAKSSVQYAPIKRYFDSTVGLASQCVAMSNVTRKCTDKTFACNVLMKINSKLGGVNVSLKDLPLALRSGTV